MQPSRRTLTVNTTLPPLAHAALLVLAERDAAGGKPKASQTILALLFAEVERLDPGAWAAAYAAAWEEQTPAAQSAAAAAALRKALGLPGAKPADAGSSTTQDVDRPTVVHVPDGASFGVVVPAERLPDPTTRAAQPVTQASCPLRAHHAKLNGRACPGGCGA